jgi:hypothetical protein
VLDDAADLAARRVALAFAQIRDLLGDVPAVEAVVGRGIARSTAALPRGPGREIPCNRETTARFFG